MPLYEKGKEKKTTNQDVPNTLPGIDILEERKGTEEKQSSDDDDVYTALVQKIILCCKPAVMSVDDTALYHA